MDTSDLRSEIHRIIETIPDEKLSNILGYIKSYQNHSTIAPSKIDKEKLDGFINKIFEEDGALLKRLADNPVKRNP